METMTLDKLKAEFPDVYKAAVADGSNAESARYQALNTLRGKNEKGDAAVAEAIASGKTFAEASPAILAAILDGMSENPDGDNPPEIVAAVPDTGAGAKDPELVAKLAKLGYTAEQIEKFAPKA